MSCPTRSPERRPLRLVLVAPTELGHAASRLLEIVETLVGGLQELGCLDSTSLNECDPEGINLIVGAHLANDAFAARLPKRCIVYNPEPLGPTNDWWEWSALSRLATQFPIWDYSHANVNRWPKRVLGAQAEWVPLGYVPSLSRIPRPPVQDIDVLFFGTLHSNRIEVLANLCQRGVNVHATASCYGEERDALIARSKLVLNLHGHASHNFEWPRVGFLLANRKAVVAQCETDTDLDPRWHSALAATPLSRLADVCLELLADDAKRHALEERGFELFSAYRAADNLRAPLERTLANFAD